MIIVSYNREASVTREKVGLVRGMQVGKEGMCMHARREMAFGDAEMRGQDDWSACRWGKRRPCNKDICRGRKRWSRLASGL